MMKSLLGKVLEVVLDESYVLGYSGVSRCMRIVEGILIVAIAVVLPEYSIFQGSWNAVAGAFSIASPEAAKVMCGVFLTLAFTSSHHNILFLFMSLVNAYAWYVHLECEATRTHTHTGTHTTTTQVL